MLDAQIPVAHAVKYVLKRARGERLRSTSTVIASPEHRLGRLRYLRRHHAARSKRRDQQPRNRTKYVYNAIGQRIEKSGGPAGTVIFAYDEGGHLLGEYSSTGALVQETIWLNDTPVATLRPHTGGGVDIYYVHADHLNSPRMVTRATDNGIMWRWDTDPFGSIAPNQNPSGLGTFAYNLRFPGQYADSETGLYYNYFRDYDPTTGRYIESDPIGLNSGINTYAYARGNPVNRSDQFGLKPGDPFSSIQAAAVDALNWIYLTYPTANIEYAGTVYLDINGNYVATNPSPGSQNESSPSYPPGGYSQVDAYYHTHGQCTKGMKGGNDVFSSGYPSDKAVADWHLPHGVPSFLETPGHKILRYDPDPERNQHGRVTQIQSGCDCPRN